MTPPRTDLLVRGIGRLLPMSGPVVSDAAVLIRAGVVAWVGTERELPSGLGELPELDVGGAAVLPGLVDCHTHLVWAGSRRDELVARLAGERYDGGGIHTTVAATTATSTAILTELTRARVQALARNGVTTLEVKTGYGLSAAEELRALAVIAAVAAAEPVRVSPTYLAHAVPPEVPREAYVAEIVATAPAAAAAGAVWCDVFCDVGAFTVDEARRILGAAAAAGLGGRLHAEQLQATGAARLAAETGCASADHLDHVSPEDARALAAAGIVGVLVPTAVLSTRSGRWGTARLLRDAGVTLAVATDCNPGTSWCESLPYAVQLACLGMGLSVADGWWAATRGGALALRADDAGQVRVGARGDLAVLAAEHEADPVAHLGAPAVATTVVGGQPIG